MRTCGLGWLLGMVFGVGGAVLAETIGLPTNQTVLGLGMGAGIGLLQGRRLAPWLGGVRPWLWRTALGLALPFLAWDLSPVEVFSLPLCMALGGLLAGVLQAPLLRDHVGAPHRWVVASAVAWALLAGVMALVDAFKLPGPIGALPVLVVMLAGGVVLGAVTRPVLRGPA